MAMSFSLLSSSSLPTLASCSYYLRCTDSDPCYIPLQADSTLQLPNLAENLFSNTVDNLILVKRVLSASAKDLEMLVKGVLMNMQISRLRSE